MAGPAAKRARRSVQTSGGLVCIVGSCNYDQTVYMPPGEKIPGAGLTVFGSHYAEGFGGKGANQAAMAALLRASTSIVGAVGDDSIGERTRRNFESLGIMVGGAGENVIVVVPGANLQLSEADVAAANETIQGCKVLLLQNEILPAVSLAAMRLARAGPEGSRPIIILNAAPAPKIGAHADRGEWEGFREHLEACDILCVNESEAEAMSGINIVDGSGIGSRPAETGLGDGLINAATEAGKELQKMGAKKVLITLGEAGAMLLSGPGPDPAVEPFMMIWSPAKSCSEVQDTSGAGDAFLGALAAFVVNSKP
ncbi:Ribokinase-like protein [Baffinella frigidus]|nr:Ribokinase-like protein [Cryptophyta sp. CCMP2293]